MSGAGMESHAAHAGADFVGIKQLGIRACGTCVKAKVKCVPNLQRGKCHRCHRLDKVCQPSSTPSRKRPTQVAQLEHKLDTLVTLLTGPNRPEIRDEPQQQLPDFSASRPKTPEASHQSRPTSSVTNMNMNTDNRPRAVRQHAFFSTPTTTPLPYDYFVSQPDTFGFEFENKEASFLLLEYRTQMASQCPWVVIPSNATCNSLRQERPTLWKAVMTAASYQNAIRQEALGWKLMEEFSTRLLLRAEKSLDLLQALLVHITWYHYHSVANPQVMNLLSLARTLAVNLGIHRTHAPKGRPKIWLDAPDGLAKQQYEPAETQVTTRTLEEWRALAGCFFLSAITTSSCRRIEPVQYTEHIDKACKTLTELQEYESDAIIFPLVSVQNVVLKISTAFTDPNLGLSTVPVKMFIKSLHSELESIKEGMSVEAAEDYTFVACYQMAEISLYEVGLYRAFHPDSDKSYHLNLLYSCLMAVKTFFHSHFSHNSPFATSFAFFRWIFAGYVLILGAKLAVCKVDGWDTRHVHEVLDCENAVNLVIAKFEAILQRRTPHGENEIFDRYLRHMRLVKAHGNPIARPCSRNSLRRSHQPKQSQSLENGQSLTPDFLTDVPQLDDFQLGADENFWQTMFDDDNDWIMTAY